MDTPLIANLKLNLDETLSPEELRELLEIAASEDKPIERVLFEAAKEGAAKRRAAKAAALFAKAS